MLAHRDPGHNATKRIALTMLAAMAGIVNKGESMNHRTTTGWLKNKKPAFMTTMVCLEHDCGHLWDASNTGKPCPKCASGAVFPADNWDFNKKGMLRLGKVNRPIMETGESDGN